MSTSGTGRKGKRVDGAWAELPEELVRHIATLYLWDRQTDVFIPHTWDHHELWHSRMVFQAVRDALDLERTIMSVCAPWGTALESHLFWQQAITLIDPTDSLSSLPRPYRLSPYRHFRHILSCSCLVCRINLPATTRGLMLAKRTISSFILGPIPLCREHDHRRLSFCGLCLRESSPLLLNPITTTPSHINTNSISENEDEDSFPGVEATCRTCRTEWLLKKGASYHVMPALGGINLISEDWETRQSVDGFVELGEGSIADVITLAKEKWWLRRWTRLGDMLQQAIAAARFNSGSTTVSTRHHQLPQQQLQRLEEISEDEEEIEEEESEDSSSSSEDDTELMQLEEGGVKDLALGDWARTRILDGYWISPADLWYRHAIPGKPLDTPAIHPCPWTLPPNHQHTPTKKLQHPTRETIKAEIPPSFTLCEQAFIAHGQQLRLILLPPMKNIVRRIAIECALANSSLSFANTGLQNGNRGEYILEDPALRISKMTLEDVVRMLREEEGVWFDGYDWVERRRNEILAAKKAARMNVRGECVEGEREGERDEEASSPASTSTNTSNSTGSTTGRGGDSSVGGGSTTTSPVLSTTTLQTTPSPPPPPSPTIDSVKSVSPIIKSVPPATAKNNSHRGGNPQEESKTATNDDIYAEISSKILIPVDPVMNPPRILRSIPFMPTTIMHLPQYSLDAVKNVWREACSPLYHCRCRICERAVAALNKNNSGGTLTTSSKDVGVVRQVPSYQQRQRDVPPHQQQEKVDLGKRRQQQQQQHLQLLTIQLDEVSEIEYTNEENENTVEAEAEAEAESGSEDVYAYAGYEGYGYQEYGFAEYAKDEEEEGSDPESESEPTSQVEYVEEEVEEEEEGEDEARTTSKTSRKRSLDEVEDEDEDDDEDAETGAKRSVTPTKRLRKSPPASSTHVASAKSATTALIVPGSRHQRKRSSEELDEDDSENDGGDKSDGQDEDEDDEDDVKKAVRKKEKKKKRQRLSVGDIRLSPTPLESPKEGGGDEGREERVGVLMPAVWQKQRRRQQGQVQAQRRVGGRGEKRSAASRKES